MKKKATLLITNLEKIYTMQTIKQKDVIYSHAYLAMHHDVILEISEEAIHIFWIKYANLRRTQSFCDSAFVKLMQFTLHVMNGIKPESCKNIACSICSMGS